MKGLSSSNLSFHQCSSCARCRSSISVSSMQKQLSQEGRKSLSINQTTRYGPSTTVMPPWGKQTKKSHTQINQPLSRLEFGGKNTTSCPLCSQCNNSIVTGLNVSFQPLHLAWRRRSAKITTDNEEWGLWGIPCSLSLKVMQGRRNNWIEKERQNRRY